MRADQHVSFDSIVLATLTIHAGTRTLMSVTLWLVSRGGFGRVNARLSRGVLQCFAVVLQSISSSQYKSMDSKGLAQRLCLPTTAQLTLCAESASTFARDVVKVQLEANVEAAHFDVWKLRFHVEVAAHHHCCSAAREASFPRLRSTLPHEQQHSRVTASITGRRR